MRKKALYICIILCVFLLQNAAAAVQAETVTLTLDVTQTGFPISQTLYGLFFEDINYAADGGLYPELVNNRSFDFTDSGTGAKRPLNGWVFGSQKLGGAEVAPRTESPLNAGNPTYISVDVTEAPYRILNNGITANGNPDMGVISGAAYQIYFYARNTGYDGSLRVILEDINGNPYSEPVEIVPDSPEWTKYGPFTIRANSGGKGRLAIECTGTGGFDIDFVSLTPTDTWGYGRSEWPHGGLRRDIAEALRDLGPGFIRFPGGCIVEGAFRHDTHYHWKDTVGPPEQRRENPNLWGYSMSYGLGFHEYFQLCADFGAEPVPVLYAGVLCQPRNNGSNTEPDLVPGDAAFDALIQDYLDLIEYANGGTDTVWGAKRAENGSTEPFALKMIGVGNENWGDRYWANFAAIKEAILSVYPEMDIITTTGPLASGWINDMAWRYINASHTDTIVDEHYYMEPEWFLQNSRRYDVYQRNGARIFVGEYAAHEPVSGDRRPNTLYAGLCEAAMMTGFERNADLVVMSSYAPLLARAGLHQWSPDMIWFNSLEITALTPSYQVQKLFANRVGTVTLPAETVTSKILFHSSSYDERTQTVYTKLVNPYTESKTVELTYAGIEIRAAVAETLTGQKTDTAALPVSETRAVRDGVLTVELPPYSLIVLTASPRLMPEEPSPVTVSPAPETTPNQEEPEEERGKTGTTLMIVMIAVPALILCVSIPIVMRKHGAGPR